MYKWLGVGFGLVGCGHQNMDPGSLAAAGHPVSAVVVAEANGGLRASTLALARTEGGEDEDDEAVAIESLPAAVRSAVDAAYPGATLLGAEHEPGEWGVELVTADGRHLEVEYDDDGNFLESEAADGDDDLAGRAFLQGTAVAGAGAELTVFGVPIDVAAVSVPPGNARFVGSFTGTLTCTTASPTVDDLTRIGGVSQGVEETADGFLITLMDRVITVDARTVISFVEDPLDPDEDDDDDEDEDEDGDRDD